LKFPSHTVAIIGMACELPGAHSPEELWQNVLAGRRFFRKSPPERLPPEYFDPDPDAPGKSYCDQMAVITDWVFDPVEFHIAPVAFQVTDMAHWLALYTAREAIRNAGLKLDSINRARVGVVLGNSLTGEFSRSHNLRFRWPYVERSIRRALVRRKVPEAQLQELLASVQQVYEAPLPEITEDTLAGNMSNTIAGRICNHFNFGAGGFIVDGACSSSLLSVATACNALASGEMDFALAGGVDVSLDPFEMIGFAKTRALATDDIRPYDEHAAGMLTGEGCGIVVLAREEDARAAGHPIHALIRGWGYSSDGAGGITAPEVEGQMRALRRAYEHAGYSISTVGLIEGHGTGTSVGDKVELTALRRLLDESPGGICRIGSIKANIGHCKAAAGIAGLIKAVMALERKIIPPTMNCESPNPAFGLPLGRLRPSTEGLAWSGSPMPRRASVSAMGFGGANAHITLEEANPEAAPSPADLSLLGSRQTSELIVLAAGETDELRHQIEKYLPVAKRLCRAELTDLSAALAKRPTSGKLRLAIVAMSPWNLAEQLKRCAEKLAGGADMAALDNPANGVFAGVALDDPKLVALFPGQGSQRLNMGGHWLGRFPFVREFYERVSQVGDETSVLGSISRHIFRDRFSANEETREAWEKELRETCIAQPAIVLSSMATLQVLQFLGLQPRIVIGHSLGEISALAAAGAWDALTAVRLAAVRGQAMGSLPLADGGSMAAVAAKPGQVGALLKPLGSALVISNYNSPRQTVVSGGSEAIQKLVHVCEGQGISCRHIAVSHAFHSDLVAPTADIFREMAGGMDIPRRAPGVPTGAVAVISTVTGSLISAGDVGLDYLAGQIRQPVRFTDAVLKVVGTQPSLWIEVGPGGALTTFVRDTLSGFNMHCLATDLAGEDGFHLLNQALARAWVLGFPVKLERLFTHRFHRPLDVDHYAPRFIINPCERIVADSSVAADAGGLAKAEGKPEVPGPTERADQATDRDSLLAFAIEWIARRTGFPKSAISPEKKLRDDLNLDSIKAGELVVSLTKKLGRRFDADPASVANSRICDLVEAVLSQTQNGGAGTDEAASRRVRLGPADGLAEWTRTFRMEFVPAPPTDGTRLPLPTTGACVIVAEPDSSRARAIADQLHSLGLATAVTDADSLLKRGDAPPDLAALILLLPEMKKPFLSCEPEEFDRRVEGTATTLFRVFRWAGHGRAGAELRGLVLRAANGAEDGGWDLDGGSGFLKSLGLEYPAANFKWLTLPTEWTPERWGEVAVQELQTGRDRVAFTYTPDGQRLSEVATFTLSHPTTEERSEGTAGSLGPDDVVLVSGGAKGITCELALALAQKTNAKLALIGSSPPPDASADPQKNEVLRNLLRFQKLGLRHLYLQADVTDLAAVQKAIHEAERLLGPATAILHGAGVTFLRLFRDKELDEFLRCVRIKARGLYNLLAAVPPARLKALHVISSVLGKTGMRGQADYALANAWLDGAVRSVKAAHPQVHCLSLGYTAWAETGLARRVGALDSLRSIGVTPVSVQEGIAAYLELVQTPQWDGDFVITGRLTSDLEANLLAPAARPRGRFLEQVHRRVPGVELVAEATLSHETDLYLPEHVFEGTPVFPGVMAIEAMVQAAMACVDRMDWPVLRNVQFHTPLIVPGNAKTVMRTLALADVPNDGAVRVRVAIRSERDGFKQNHFAAECWFEKERNNSRSPGFPLPESLPEPLNKDPEEFSPVPLFQGKFFRRITAIRKMTMGEESLTEIQVPVGEQYFRHILDDAPATPSPVVRDACLQSGALILPPGCLPDRIEELHFLGRARPEEKVLCGARVRNKSPDEFVVDIAVFDSGGKLLEAIRGLRLKQTGTGVAARPSPGPVDPERVPGDLQALLPKRSYAIALVDHEELKKPAKLSELSAGELERLKAEIALPRQVSAMANLVATRRAALAYGRRMYAFGVPASAGQAQEDSSAATAFRAMPPEGGTVNGVALVYRADGKPELRFADESVAKAFQGADVSLADSNGFSVAWIGPAPAGIDIESVEKRDTETWRGLLGDDGYALALRVSAQTAEPFDLAATRVWTLVEAGRKANGLKRIIPGYESSLGGPWLCFAGATDNDELEFLSVALAMLRSGNSTCGRPGAAVLTVAVGRVLAEPPCPSESAGTGWSTSFEALLADFRAGMERLKILCAKDPQSPGAEARHAEFISVIEKTSQRLKPLEKTVGAVDLMALRGQFQKTVLEYLEGSENFRHTLVKPFGYAGDFQLLEMLAGNTCTSRGLAYHFDQSQLEYPASAACRRRIEWISGELSDRLERRKAQSLSILDLGIGAATIEQRLLRQHPEIALCVHAVDLEPAALEQVHRVLIGGNRIVHPWRLNLRDPAAMAKVGELAAQADAVIAIGILEALTDAEAVRLLQTVLRSLLAGGVFYTENFVPTHPTRSVMEWFQDFHLAYRSLDELKTLALQAGADPSCVELKLDSTGSLALLKMKK
jgi:enediyne polyketide synthase